MDNRDKDINGKEAISSGAVYTNIEDLKEPENDGVVEYILKRPFSFLGEEKTNLVLNFEDLTAKDLEASERAARKRLDKKESLNVPEVNKKYLACVAAKAAGVPVDCILAMYARDFTQITVLTQNFLLGDSEDTDEMEQ